MTSRMCIIVQCAALNMHKKLDSAKAKPNIKPDILRNPTKSVHRYDNSALYTYVSKLTTFAPSRLKN